MSSVSSANSGLAYLTQLLSSTGSPVVSSTLSSSQVQSALQNASAADIVQLSDQALELQGVDALFGVSDTSSTPSLFSSPSESDSSQSLDQILTTLSGTSSSTSQTSNPITSSLAYQVANYQSQLQGEELQAFSGVNAPTYL